MRKLTRILGVGAAALSLTVISFVGVTSAHAAAADHNISSSVVAPPAPPAPANSLSPDEIAGLAFMREEEKLARDVYLTLDQTWDSQIFANIARSEQRHMDAVKTLLDRYGIADPAAGNDIGQFTDPDLQTLYADLTAQGQQSLADALRVGALIEEVDIADLIEELEAVEHNDIRRVYEQLLQGSENHLRAFVAALERQAGETYQPQVLYQATYDQIISAVSGGGPGQAQRPGRGKGQGRGN